MKNRTATNAQTPEALLNDLRALVSDAELMLNESPGENGSEPLATLRERFDAAQQRLADLYARASKEIASGWNCADQAIRANPYQSMGLALGVGMLLGIFVVRRNP